MIDAKTKREFSVGLVRITHGAMSGLSPEDVFHGLSRHTRGDWGDLDEHDWKENDAALEHGFRLFSQYSTQGGTKFWIITEWDRSVTTILLPEEY